MSQRGRQPFVPSGPGHAVCLVGYDQDGKCYITPEATAALQLLQGPLAVISVCGRAGQGKSFLSNQLLGRTRGFPLSPTRGLWIWSAPIIRTAADGSTYNLVVMDTEAIDLESSSPHLFLLSLLLSSLVIYNQMGGFEGSSLEEWSSVTELHKRIQQQALSPPTSAHPQLAVLVWLLRDYNSLSDPSPHLLTPELDPDPASSPAMVRQNEIRASIRALFPHQERLQLPRPLARKGQRLDMVAEEELRPEFVGGVEALKRCVFGADHATLTGPILASFTRTYIAAVYDGESPPTPMRPHQTEFGSDPQLDAGLSPEARETLLLRSLSSRLSLPLSEVEQREVKLQVKTSVAAAGDNPMATSLLTQLRCVEGDFEAALNLLSASCLPRACVLSNASYIHCRMGKLSLASFYSAKALKAKGSDVEGGGSAFAMLYHAALFMLQQGKASQAALCFQHSAPLYHNSPLLWLRVAECCVRMHRRGELALSPQVAAEGQLSLEAGRSCLKNALRLLTAGGSSTGMESTQDALTKQYAYANLTYLELSLRQYKAAIEVASSLLAMPTCLPEYKAIAHHYLAEAFFMTANPHKALEHALQGLGGEDDKRPGSSDALKFACKGRLAGNVASILSSLGDAEKAQQVLEECGAGSKTWEEKLSRVHVELLNGHGVNETLGRLEHSEQWSDVKTTK